MHTSCLAFNSGTTTKSKVLFYAQLASHIYVVWKLKGENKFCGINNSDPMSLWELTVPWAFPAVK